MQGTPLWWWLGAAAINAASIAVPASIVKPAGASTALLLSAAWIWPALIWSRLGTQRHENGLDTLLGTASRTHRMFQALYVILWYAAVNQVQTVNYMGTVLVNGRPAGPSPLLIASAALAMLAVTFTIRTAQHTRR